VYNLKTADQILMQFCVAMYFSWFYDSLISLQQGQRAARIYRVLLLSPHADSVSFSLTDIFAKIDLLV